jgi:hypothetical protein
LSAVSTALAAYVSLCVFEQQSKIYGDAARAVRAAAKLPSGGRLYTGPDYSLYI